MTLLTESLPGSRIEIEDLRGDGNHYAVTVESRAFVGVPLVDQHRMVFAALQGRVGGILRGITLTTLLPKEDG
ncbi:MAG: BolA/IbaG family iron-sulfur metabolism protein [Alphaproteobacteria bacterium]|nr:BolA/IbaG family iron-sulfur metabolism protein [Alphaproteobacteria bacterium]